MAEKLAFRYHERLTRVGQAVADSLEAEGQPIITPYELSLKLFELYTSGKHLYLRKPRPEISDYRRLRRNLTEAKVVASDKDYKQRAYRVVSASDLSADDICCIVDPFCYISHLSAMQRYGLTDRRPEALHLSRPDTKIIRQLIERKTDEDLKKFNPSMLPIVRLTAISHPPYVRGRKIQIFQTTHPGKYIAVRASFARISTIGQTFLDMVEEPPLCSGMSHVLDVWRQHAKAYLDDVINAIDTSHSSIAKVRAGYILDEILSIKDDRLDQWTKFAQRGGSRLLDPTKKYAPKYSERWKISINV